MDEILGSNNFISSITFKKTSSASSELLAGVNDYLLWYGKDKEKVKYRQLYRAKEPEGRGGGQYNWVEEPNGVRRGIHSDESLEHIPLGSRLFRHSTMTSQRPPGDFPVSLDGRVYRPKTGYWKTGDKGMELLKYAGRLMAFGNTLEYVRYLDDFPVFPITNIWEDTVTSGFADPKVYVVQTNSHVAERALLMTTDPGDLVLDPTCGSGTTAYVAEQWGRRWITIDTSRVALALARTRLMAARFPYYYLADSCPQMTQMNADEDIKNYLRQSASSADKKSPSSSADSSCAPPDIRKGFVYKRVPHVTLKSIANNPDIKEGMTRAEIDAAIRRHAETETLYDQPYEDKNRIRVSGPFTVESLSPDRIVSTDEERPASELVGQKHPGRADFATMILDNLRKAGVQNTFKNERLKFDRLESHAGAWIHATGDYTNGDGKTRRVAVTIGPEYGTVTPQQVKEAAKEAVFGIGFDILIVCGFAFDPHVSEEVKRYGKLTVLPARMNPDLLIGDTLKNTGAGNLFMIFGEPDIAITRDADGKLVVEVKGVDVYDPTTGQIRSSSTDDIACWFIDTDYNGECFFVRHAYFLGADDPYGKLKRALRAEIDEAQWSALYSTKSYPYEPPKSGKIAVKVINHYGDEVLKIYSTHN